MMFNNKVKFFLVFIIFFVLFLAAHLLLNGQQFTSSDDPYYHAKHAFLIAQSGQLNLVKPWLEWHFFNYAPTDIWWGYHLAAALFIHWFGLMAGVKIFASFLAALVFLVFYLVLVKSGAKYPSVWTALLFCSSTVFSFRLFLERPHVLSMLVLPLAFLFLAKGKNFWLFVLSLAYALCYHFAPLIILLPIIYLLADIYVNKRLDLKPLIAAAGGVLAGIIIHPNGLNYLYVMFITIGRILFLKFAGVDLNIGGELQTRDFFDFLYNNFLVLLVYVLAAALFLSFKKSDRGSLVGIFLFLYSSLWFLLTLLVPRGVEGWSPAVFLFAAAIFSRPSLGAEFKQLKNWLAGKVNLKIAAFFLISALALLVFRNLSNVFFDLEQNKTGQLGQSYQEVNNWLKANTAKDSVVFYDNWGMWPMMFFYNDHNHYITGIDPTFFYEYDQRAYWLWRQISSSGLYCDQLEPCLGISPRQQLKLAPLAIKTIFRAQYAVLANYEQSNLIKTLNSLKSEAKLVLENKDLLVYEMQ